MANFVTVLGAHNETVSLQYDSAKNAEIARQLAGQITAGVRDLSILPWNDTDGPAPTVPAGKSGEFVQKLDGFTALQHGYTALVDVAANATISGSGDDNQMILASNGNFDFISTGGSGTVVGGHGNDQVRIPGTDPGNWGIYLGNGDNRVLALGSGNDSISTGSGHNLIRLGSGQDILHLHTGNDTVRAGGGSDTIHTNGHLRFVGDTANVSIFGQDGSVTVIGGSGDETVHGGSQGNNLIFAGTGQASLFGGGDGDRLVAQGSQSQTLRAAGGNESLFGGSADGPDRFVAGWGADRIILGAGDDTVVAGTGSATVSGGTGNDIYQFINSQAGGQDLIQNFTAGDHVLLQGYGPNVVAQVLATQTTANGSVTVTLPDNTTVTFSNVTQLTQNDFLTK